MISILVGCLIGVLIYSLLALVTPIAKWNAWSQGILIFLCLISQALVGRFF